MREDEDENDHLTLCDGCAREFPMSETQDFEGAVLCDWCIDAARDAAEKEKEKEKSP